MQYLVDTSWIISYQRGFAPVVQRLNRLLPLGVGMSIISLAEFYGGIVGSRSPETGMRALRDFRAAGVDLVDLDDEICWKFAEERRRLRARGTIIADLDLLIGATALRHDLTLLTNNRRHFERLPNLRIMSA